MSDDARDINRRVLIVDDNLSIHKDYRAVLCVQDTDAAAAAAAAALASAHAALFGETLNDGENIGNDANSAPATQPVRFDLASAFQGRDAVAMASAAAASGTPFAMAFIDMRMPPGWDGLETIQRLWRADPRIEVVLCSAFSDYSWSEVTTSLGCTDRLLILKKPFDVNEVRQIAMSLTTKWNLARAAEASMSALEQRVRERTAKLEASERDLRVARDAAEAASRAKSEFLATMSHEIRTPLNGITGVLDLLSGTALDERQHQCLRVASASVGVLLTTINDILDFSKIEAGRLDLEQVSFDLVETVEDVVCGFAPSAAKTRIELVCHVDDDVPTRVVGDPSRLRQVIANLIGNALKFTHAGHVELRMSLQDEDAHGSLIRCAVSDTGIGIAPERVGRLFQSFVQADASTTRKYGGTGLGLAICKRLVELMGGDISVQSTLGKGSTFTFDVHFAYAPHATRASSLMAAGELKGTNILVVDDDPAAARALAAYLGPPASANVDVAATAAQAIDALRVHQQFQMPVGLIFLDCDDASSSLLREIKLEPALADARLIAVQGLGQQMDAKTLSAAGFVAAVTKPLRRAAVAGAVATAAAPSCTNPYGMARGTKEPDDLAKLHVLVAEDNDVNQFIIQRVLASRGIICDLVGDGRQAVEAATRHHYDAVLMDCAMPELDGFDATRAIRAAEAALPQGRRVPIIALTAQAVSGDRERCAAVGMDAYVSKPIDSAELFSTLRRHALAAKPAERSPAQPAAISLDELYARCLGDAELAGEVLDIFQRRVAKDACALEQSVRAQDPVETARLARELQRAAAQAGAIPLCEAAEALHQACRSADRAQVDAAVATAREHVDRCLAAIPAVSNALTSRAGTMQEAAGMKTSVRSCV